MSSIGEQTQNAAIAASRPDRLLQVSHRCLGFGSSENSLKGLISALHSGVAQVELDLRLTADSQHFALHMPYYFTRKGRLRWISKVNSQRALSDNLLPLGEILQAFEKNGQGKDLRLELKVAGQEKELLEQLETAGILKSVILASWNPTILNNLAQLNPQVRLAYSFLEHFTTPKQLLAQLKKLPPLDSLCILPLASRFSLKLLKPYLKSGCPLFVVGSFTSAQQAELLELGVRGVLAQKF